MNKSPNVLQNIGYILKEIWKHKRVLYFNCFIYTVMNGISVFAGLYIPPRIIDALLNTAAKQQLIVLLILFAVTGFAVAYARLLFNQAYAMMIQFRFVLCEYHQRTCLSVPFEQMETLEFEDRVFSAFRCIANNSSGIEGAMHRLYEWPSYVTILIISSTALFKSGLPLFALACAVGIGKFYIACIAANKKDVCKPEQDTLARKVKYYGYMMKDRDMALELRLPLIQRMLSRRYVSLRKAALALKCRQTKIELDAELIDALVDVTKDAIVFVYLILSVLAGRLTIGTLILCINAVESFSAAIESPLKDYRAIRDDNYSICEFRSFITDTDCREQKGGIQISRIESIQFDHVSYSYPNAEKKALDDVCVSIHRGDHVAIVGENGAGKTTFIKLLLGLYSPHSGRILVNGLDLCRIEQKSYYRSLAVLFQDFHILAFSIAENIALSETAFDEDSIHRVLDTVHLQQRIEDLTKGIYTPAKKTIEDYGTEFSGGEAQRLALARTLYKKADMVVLDEPSASLDPVEENKLYTLVDSILKDQTVIFVSHRLASTRFCDKILYFQNGRITENGTHTELIKNNRGYAALYNSQSQFYKN